MKALKTKAMIAMIAAMISVSAMAGTFSQQAGPYASWLNAEDLDNGYGAGLKYNVMYEGVLPRLGLGLDVRGGWLMFEGDDNDYGTDLDMFPVEATALASYEVFDGAKPYAGVGIGGYFFDEDDDAVDVDDELGFYVVLGWDQSIMKHLSVFAEAKYLWLEPEAKGPAGVEQDLDVGGFGANVGICMNW